MKIKKKIKMGVSLLFFSGCTLASDLVFKTGFENQYLIGGHVDGLQSSSLVLALISVSGPGEVTLTEDGSFYFERLVNAGHAWRVELQTLPNQPQQSCLLSNNHGSALPVGGVNDVQISCLNQVWDWDVMNWDEGGWNE